MSEVPSVEQSSTMISSRSMFSGRGAASTQRDAPLHHGALVVDRHQDRQLHCQPTMLSIIRTAMKRHTIRTAVIF